MRGSVRGSVRGSACVSGDMNSSTIAAGVRAGAVEQIVQIGVRFAHVVRVMSAQAQYLIQCESCAGQLQTIWSKQSGNNDFM